MLEDYLSDRGKKELEKVKKYESGIETVEDLVRFMFTYNVSYTEEYTDWAAREAARNKAIQLLGIEL